MSELEVRDYHVLIPITEEERWMLKTVASNNQLSVREWVKRLVLRELEPYMGGN